MRCKSVLLLVVNRQLFHCSFFQQKCTEHLRLLGTGDRRMNETCSETSRENTGHRNENDKLARVKPVVDQSRDRHFNSLIHPLRLDGWLHVTD